MRGWTVTAVGVLLVGLAGCQTTPEALREKQACREVHVVDGNYQAVYRYLLGKARSKAGHSPAIMVLDSSDMRVEHELYPDLKQAEVALVLYGPAGTNTPFLLDIAARDEVTTMVTAYYDYGGTWRSEVRKWLAEPPSG